MSEFSVAKFGGTSMSEMYRDVKSKANNFSHIVVSAPGKRNSNDTKLTQDLESENVDISLVLSRFEHMTNNREDLRKLEEELKSRLEIGDKDEILAFGEYGSAYLLANELGEGFEFLDAKNCLFQNKDGKVGFKQPSNNSRKLIIPGFYYRAEDNSIKTFSRGGSDVSGAIIARSLRSSYHIFTDFCIYNADPRKIQNPGNLEELTYQELRHLSKAGFEIVHRDVWRIMEKTNRDLVVMGTEEDLIEGDKTTIMKNRVDKSNNPYIALGLVEGITSIVVDNHREMDHFDLELEKRLKEIGKYKLTSTGGFGSTTYLFNDLNSQTLNKIITSFNDVGKVIDTSNNLYGIVVVGQAMKDRQGTLCKIVSSINQNIKAIAQDGSQNNISIFVDGDPDLLAYRSVYDKLFRNYSSSN